jgi:hypothetical protein
MYISMVLVFSKIVMVDVTGMQVSEFSFGLSLHLRPEAETKACQFFVVDADVKGAYVGRMWEGSIDVIPSVSLFPAVLSEL